MNSVVSSQKNRFGNRPVFYLSPVRLRISKNALTANSPISVRYETFSIVVPWKPSLMPLYKIHKTKRMLPAIAANESNSKKDDFFFHFHHFEFNFLAMNKIVKITNQDNNGTTSKLNAGFACEVVNCLFYFF